MKEFLEISLSFDRKGFSYQNRFHTLGTILLRILHPEKVLESDFFINLP